MRIDCPNFRSLLDSIFRHTKHSWVIESTESGELPQMTFKCQPCVEYAIFDVMGQITRAVMLVAKRWLHKMSNQLKLTDFLK